MPIDFAVAEFSVAIVTPCPGLSGGVYRDRVTVACRDLGEFVVAGDFGRNKPAYFCAVSESLVVVASPRPGLSVGVYGYHVAVAYRYLGELVSTRDFDGDVAVVGGAVP